APAAIALAPAFIAPAPALITLMSDAIAHAPAFIAPAPAFTALAPAFTAGGQGKNRRLPHRAEKWSRAVILGLREGCHLTIFYEATNNESMGTLQATHTPQAKMGADRENIPSVLTRADAVQ